MISCVDKICDGGRIDSNPWVVVDMNPSPMVSIEEFPPLASACAKNASPRRKSAKAPSPVAEIISNAVEVGNSSFNGRYAEVNPSCDNVAKFVLAAEATTFAAEVAGFCEDDGLILL